MTTNQKLTELLKSYLPTKYTAVSYCISIGDQQFSGTVGHQGDKEKTEANDNCTFNVASVSKIYCAVAVMQLVEKGIVTLDTPVVEYLPDLFMPDDRFKAITLRHCLNHACGLPGTQWKGFSVSSVEGEDYFSYVREYLANNQLKATPGNYSVYCNDGFTVAEMVVERMTGMNYSQYCLEAITAPISAHSSRLPDLQNPEYPLIREDGRPPELLLIKGGAGYTTNMTDLCKFGRLFLEPNAIISEESKAEMAKTQGSTFLKSDERSCLYGLGWDNVAVQDPEMDLGENVLLKGGNSFQFTTQLLILPKYNAVLAMSETHDCKLDVNAVLLRLFAAAMAEEHQINLYKNSQFPSKEMAEKFAGEYILPSGVFKLEIIGSTADINRVAYCGKGYNIAHRLLWNGEVFLDDKKQRYTLEEHEGETYLLTEAKGRMMPMAQKAKSQPNSNAQWEKRCGKQYIAFDFTVNDIVIHDIMSGFTVIKPETMENVYILSMAGRSDSGVYGFFEGAVTPTGDNTGAGFIHTPSNPSRDQLYPVFYTKDGVEYCKVASYHYISTEGLSNYQGESFTDGNTLYRFNETLHTLPEIPSGKRLVLLDDKMVNHYDSLFGGEYKALDKGYILFIS